MWTCPSCGTSNEPHAIFCSACGAMRYKAPARQPASPPPASPPELLLPEFRGTATGFVFAWIGATTGGAFAGWVAQIGLSRALAALSTRGYPDFAWRVSWSLLYGVVFGVAIGALQAMVLHRTVDRPGWGGWMWANLAGAVVASLTFAAFPFTGWNSASLADRMLPAAAAGIAGGAFAGLLQARVLARTTGIRGWIGWAPVAAGAGALGNLAGVGIWSLARENQLSWMAWAFAVSAVQVLLDNALTGFLTGLPLAIWLRGRIARLRAASESTQD